MLSLLSMWKPAVECLSYLNNEKNEITYKIINFPVKVLKLQSNKETDTQRVTSVCKMNGVYGLFHL